MRPTMRRGLLWILLGWLGLALAILVARHDQDTAAGMLNDQFASLAMQVALVVFVGGMVLALFRQRFAHALEAALLWAIVAVLLMVGYTFRFELRDIGDRVLSELV